jgi:hypothetical protein
LIRRRILQRYQRKPKGIVEGNVEAIGRISLVVDRICSRKTVRAFWIHGLQRSNVITEKKLRVFVRRKVTPKNPLTINLSDRPSLALTREASPWNSGGELPVTVSK